MKIIEVIPISRGIGKETLSYFTGEEVRLGSIVSVPLRSKKIPGLVVKVADAAEEKSAIKAASFAVKKIDSLSHHDFLSPEFIESVIETARYTATSTGSILSALLPKTILEHVQKKSDLAITLPENTA